MILRIALICSLSAILHCSSAVAEDAEKTKAAIDRAVTHLQTHQKQDGSWEHHNKVGMTSLCGLALLHAGVPTKDERIQKAAAFVREQIPELTHTYSVSLAYLFLDKLGWDKDIPLLEGLAVRLLMGQNDYGGWSYHCQLPREKEIGRLAEIAKENNATPYEQGKRRVLSKERALAQEIKLMLERMDKERKVTNNENQHLGDTSNTFFATLGLTAAFDLNIPMDHAMAQVDRRFGLTINRSGWSYYPGRPPPQQVAVKVPVVEGPQFNAANLNAESSLSALRTVYRSMVIAAGRGVDSSLQPPNYNTVSKSMAVRNILVKGHVFPPGGIPWKDVRRDPRLLRNVEWVLTVDIPIGQAGDPAPAIPALPKVGFTTMVLTGPPAEMTMIESQGETGKLSPNPRPIGPTYAMTADAICCLAMGIAANPKPPPFLNCTSDQVHQVRKFCIQQGLQHIAPYIGEVLKDPKKVTKLKKDNTYYFLFALNQLGNLLDLKTIGGKDYRAWGEQLLLANQKRDGSWQGAFGPADTAFAILFLTKANVAPGASERLRGIIQDPGPPKVEAKKGKAKSSEK